MRIILAVLFVLGAMDQHGLYAEETIDFPEYPKWDLSTDFPVYEPSNLWDYINGAADGYLSYGFENLIMAEYTHNDYSIMVEVYNHKNEDNAFGIYSSERSADYDFLDIGAQGYQEGSILNFLAGDKYVKIHADSDKKSVVKAMKEIARKLADNLGSSFGFPEILDYFPESGKLPNQQKFIAQNFLGLQFFNNVFTANYKENDENFTLFISPRSSQEDGRILVEKYLEFTDQELSDLKESRYLIKDPYNGDIHLVWNGNMIYGITGCENQELIDNYLDKMENLME